MVALSLLIFIFSAGLECCAERKPQIAEQVADNFGHGKEHESLPTNVQALRTQDGAFTLPARRHQGIAG